MPRPCFNMYRCISISMCIYIYIHTPYIYVQIHDHCTPWQVMLHGLMLGWVAQTIPSWCLPVGSAVGQHRLSVNPRHHRTSPLPHLPAFPPGIGELYVYTVNHEQLLSFVICIYHAKIQSIYTCIYYIYIYTCICLNNIYDLFSLILGQNSWGTSRRDDVLPDSTGACAIEWGVATGRKRPFWSATIGTLAAGSLRLPKRGNQTAAGISFKVNWPFGLGISGELSTATCWGALAPTRSSEFRAAEISLTAFSRSSALGSSPVGGAKASLTGSLGPGKGTSVRAGRCEVFTGPLLDGEEVGTVACVSTASHWFEQLPNITYLKNLRWQRIESPLPLPMCLECIQPLGI